MLRVICRLIADTVLVAILLFLAAGTVDWPQAWALLVTMLLVRAVGVIAVEGGGHPAVQSGEPIPEPIACH